MASLNKAKSFAFRLLFLLLLSVLLVVVILCLSVYRNIKRRHQEELSRIEDIAEETSKLLVIANSELVQLQGTHTTLEDKYLRLQHSFCMAYQNQLSELGRLCEIGISEIDAATIKSKAITASSERIEKLIKDIRERSDGQASLEKGINASLDNIIIKIRGDFPEFNDEDILFICYMAMHFDTTTIAFLANLSKANIRVKKHRYREKIFSKSTPNLELYRIVLQ